MKQKHAHFSARPVNLRYPCDTCESMVPMRQSTCCTMTKAHVISASGTGQCQTYILIWCCDVQLHAAVVELSAAKNADIKYSTVQNWYPGDAEGKGGIYNFVTKRALCHGANSKVSWTQVRLPCQVCCLARACRQVCKSARMGSSSVIMCSLSWLSYHENIQTCLACLDPACIPHSCLLAL